MQISPNISETIRRHLILLFFFFSKGQEIKGGTLNGTQRAMHIHIAAGIYRLKESSHRRDSKQKAKARQEGERKKRLLPGVVLLPEADCWTKATRHKPTNPKLARIKACAYMFTSSVVETRVLFLPLICDAQEHTQVCV